VANLADQIESYLEALFLEGNLYELEVQRVEVARFFSCAPSQVTYVLATRFTPERGYVVSSRRGGGGFVRITRLVSRNRVLADIMRATELPLDQSRASDFVDWLMREGLCSTREAAILRLMTHRDAIGLPLPVRDQVRARLLRAACLALLAGTSPEDGKTGDTGPNTTDPEG
jgi:transcriptional regulator CtsR